MAWSQRLEREQRHQREQQVAAEERRQAEAAATATNLATVRSGSGLVMYLASGKRKHEVGLTLQSTSSSVAIDLQLTFN